MKQKESSLSRRDLLRWASAAGLSGLLVPEIGWAQTAPELRMVPAKERKLLFVVAAYGGASIIDSFMPLLDSEVPDFFLAQTLNVFPEYLVEQRAGQSLRTVKLLDDYGIYTKPTFSLGDFVARHGADVAVVGHEVSSVNHTVGQQRSLNGAGINRGRTLMEAMALRYGGGLPVPSCNMASDGYVRHGADVSVPLEARHELIASPLLFGAGTHGYKGISAAPADAVMLRARAARDQLDQSSVFARTFKSDVRRERYLYTRSKISPRLEAQSLIEKLMLLDTSGLDPKFGLKQDVVAQSVRAALPNLESDRIEAQVALGFLLAYQGVSTSVALGFPTDPYVTAAGAIQGSPLAFDFSHSSHRQIQSLMWSRTAAILDKLITLLKTHDYLGDPLLGKMWDRSLVYVASEFGRDKTRPFFSDDWGTGHDLNNGSLLISPLLKGNAVYGGVDPNTCHTYSCDPVTGAPTPDKVFNEADVYGIIAHALDLDSPSTGKYPAIVRGG
jgi:hypothetical protein